MIRRIQLVTTQTITSDRPNNLKNNLVTHSALSTRPFRFRSSQQTVILFIYSHMIVVMKIDMSYTEMTLFQG